MRKWDYTFINLLNFWLSERQLDSHFHLCIWETPSYTHGEMSEKGKERPRFLQTWLSAQGPCEGSQTPSGVRRPRVRIVTRKSQAPRGVGGAGGTVH